MITTKQIDIYKKYKGDSDGIDRAGTKNERDLLDSETWVLIQSLLQDIFLVSKGVVSKSFLDELNNRINICCENQKTIDELIKLATVIYGSDFKQ